MFRWRWAVSNNATSAMAEADTEHFWLSRGLSGPTKFHTMDSLTLGLLTRGLSGGYRNGSEVCRLSCNFRRLNRGHTAAIGALRGEAPNLKAGVWGVPTRQHEETAPYFINSGGVVN